MWTGQQELKNMMWTGWCFDPFSYFASIKFLWVTFLEEIYIKDQVIDDKSANTLTFIDSSDKQLVISSLTSLNLAWHPFRLDLNLTFSLFPLNVLMKLTFIAFKFNAIRHAWKVLWHRKCSLIVKIFPTLEFCLEAWNFCISSYQRSHVTNWCYSILEV